MRLHDAHPSRKWNEHLCCLGVVRNAFESTHTRILDLSVAERVARRRQPRCHTPRMTRPRSASRRVLVREHDRCRCHRADIPRAALPHHPARGSESMTCERAGRVATGRRACARRERCAPVTRDSLGVGSVAQSRSRLFYTERRSARRRDSPFRRVAQIAVPDATIRRKPPADHANPAHRAILTRW